MRATTTETRPRTATSGTPRRRPLLRLVTAVLAAGVLLAACGGDDDASSDDDGDTAEQASGSGRYGDEGDGESDDTSADDASADDAAGATGDATVAVASDDELGEFLVGPDGLTLYLFEQDQGTTTACTGVCADNWPPLVAAEPTGGEGVDADELSTAEGIEPDQVVYHGHLLYYFAADEAPGDTNGTAVPSWFAVDPDGEAIAVG